MAKVKEEKEKLNRALKAEKGAIDFDPAEKDLEVSAKSKLDREGKNSKGGRRKREFENEEYYLKEKYDSVIESLNVFKNDPLFFKPGELQALLPQSSPTGYLSRMPDGNLQSSLPCFSLSLTILPPPLARPIHQSILCMNLVKCVNVFSVYLESLNTPFFLSFLPGSQYLYSTHGFTLLSAVVERASGHKFTDYMLKIFHDLDMLSTVLDDNEPLIYNRAR